MSSPLIKLPPELRNSIHELAIGDVEEVKINQHGYFADQPALLATCRQIRIEALPVFEHRAREVSQGQHALPREFQFHVHNFDYRHVQAFTAIPEQLLMFHCLEAKGRVEIVITMEGKKTKQAKSNLERWLAQETNPHSRRWSLPHYEFAGAVPTSLRAFDRAFGKQLMSPSDEYGTSKLSWFSYREWQRIRSAWDSQLEHQDFVKRMQPRKAAVKSGKRGN